MTAQTSLVRKDVVVGIIAVLMLGAIAAAAGSYYIGMQQGRIAQIEEDGNQRAQHDRQFAAQLALAFNQRIDNTKSQISSLCYNTPGYTCNQTVLNAELAALDLAKINSTTIEKILTG